MKQAPQITLRNIPGPVDRYLRRRAKQTGKSLNQTIIDELSDHAGIKVNGAAKSLLESLDWLIDSGMDHETRDVLERMEHEQKALAAREIAKLDEISKL